MTYQILVVDDDLDVARTIELSLRRHEEFQVTLALSGAEALQTIRRSPPDLVVLDIIMPGMDGHEVCSQLRTDPLHRDLPILFLSAKGQVGDRIEGLSLGADDYMAKPYHIEELVLRIKAILRRVQRKRQREEDASASTMIQVGGLILDTKTFQATVENGRNVLLTPVEFDLLYHLMSNAGTVFSSSRLLQEVWNYPYDTGSPDLVRMHIRNLTKDTAQSAAARLSSDGATPRLYHHFALGDQGALPRGGVTWHVTGRLC